MVEKTLSIVTTNEEMGALTKITGACGRCLVSVKTLACGNAETPGDLRITMVVAGDERKLDLAYGFIRKLEEVKSIAWLDESGALKLEAFIARLKPEEDLAGLRALADAYFLRMISLQDGVVALMGSVAASEMENVVQKLRAFNLTAIVRSGLLALAA